MQPTLLNALANSESSIIVTWSNPETGGGVDDIERFVVSWNPSNGRSKQDVEFNTTTANISNLTSNTRYNISVTAYGIITGMGDLSYTKEITCKQ